MRLYVICRRCGIRILIQSTATVRGELPFSFRLTCYQGHTDTYFSHEVFAEPDVGKAPAGVILGGILGGIIAGPVGAISGAILAGGAGASADAADRVAVERFNGS